jgi:ABC-type transport system involved in multi-copper enzyme maturation permease subunit
MLKYWKADFRRILSSKVFWVIVVFCIAIYPFGLSIVGGSHDPGDVFEVMGVAQLMSMIILGLGMYFVIYVQDVSAGALRVAIGHGLGRSKIVLVKFVESVVSTAVLSAILYVWYRFLPEAMGWAAAPEISQGALNLTVNLALSMVLFSAFASIWIFARQQSIGALVIFFLFVSQLLDQLLQELFRLDIFDQHVPTIGMYTPNNVINALASPYSLDTTGTANTLQIVMFFVYLVVAIALSMGLFHKKELEF